MSLNFLFLGLATCLLCASGVLSIRYGGNVNQKRPENQGLVLIHHLYPESDLRYSIGTLIHRKFAITHGKIIDSEVKKVWIRIGGLKMFHGGEVRYLDWFEEIRATPEIPDLFRVTLMRLEKPYELFEMAFLVVPGLSPASLWAKFTVNGYHGDCVLMINKMNHELNSATMIKADKDYCFQETYAAVKAWKDYLRCFSSTQCGPKECANRQTVDHYDSGAGVYIKSTNIVVGIVVARFFTSLEIAAKTPKMLTIRLDPVYDKIITMMREKDYDEFEDYPEWLDGWNPFNYHKRKKAMATE